MEKEIYKRCCDFALRVIKSSISANIAEGSAAVSRKEFINYLGIARKSAVETVRWLKLLFQPTNNKEFENFIDESQQIVNILSKIIINIKKR